MIQFRVYLRAELGKVHHCGDAQNFVQAVPYELLRDCGLPTDGLAVTQRLHDQAAVDAFVIALSDENARKLATVCSNDWRGNDVFDKLETLNAWYEADVPVELIELQQAEKELGHLFRENDDSLCRIAADKRILESNPYRNHRSGEVVQFPTCLALKLGSKYRIFDGMHRAIQLARNGEGSIRLCYAEKRFALPRGTSPS